MLLSNKKKLILLLVVGFICVNNRSLVYAGGGYTEQKVVTPPIEQPQVVLEEEQVTPIIARVPVNLYQAECPISLEDFKLVLQKMYLSKGFFGSEYFYILPLVEDIHARLRADDKLYELSKEFLSRKQNVLYSCDKLGQIIEKKIRNATQGLYKDLRTQRVVGPRSSYSALY